MIEPQHVLRLFRILCSLTTISLCIYWCYQFSLNEGSSEINYKKISPELDDAVLPSLSLCLENPFLNYRLAEFGTNNISYLSFLNGTSFDKKMLRIDFNSVTTNITDHIKEFRIYFKNGTDKKYNKEAFWISNNFNGFMFGQFYKCFSLQIPKTQNLTIFRVRLSNTIFNTTDLDGIRPTKWFTTWIHLSQHFLVPSNYDKWVWDEKGKQSFYNTRFIVRSYEFYRKRSTSQNNCCENWQNFDAWVLRRFEKQVGCRSPYQTSNKIHRMCDSQDQIRRFFDYQAMIADGIYQMPCNTMENIIVDFLETIDGESEAVESQDKLLNDNKGFGYFWIGIGFYASSYKEVINKR